MGGMRGTLSTTEGHDNTLKQTKEKPFYARLAHQPTLERLAANENHLQIYEIRVLLRFNLKCECHAAPVW